MTVTERSLPLASTNYGYLYSSPLEASARNIADSGYAALELAAVPPHTEAFDAADRRRVARILKANGLRVCSVNPTFTDLNLISGNREWRRETIRQLVATTQLAHELQAPQLVLVPGRRNALIPMPDAIAFDLLDDGIEALTKETAGLGVTFALENTPYGFIETGRDLAEAVERLRGASVGVVYDFANAAMVEDPTRGLQDVRDCLSLAHISDTARDRWRHGRPGSGAVDFRACANALIDVSFAGYTVFELATGEDPSKSAQDDLAALVGAGWTGPARGAALEGQR